MVGIDAEAVFQKLLSYSGADGIYGRKGDFELVVRGLNGVLDELRPTTAERLDFPPVMRRLDLEKSGYFKNFPQLSATVHAFDVNKEVTGELVETASDLVLTPAACYPIYSYLAQDKRDLGTSNIFDTTCYCFRREPSRCLDRMQSFRMREFVIVGTPQVVLDFRGYWAELMPDLLVSLGFSPEVVTASDPFFGPLGNYLARIQKNEALKYELLLPIIGDGERTAVMSFNYHQGHFGHLFDLQTPDGEVAHSSCFAVGIDRLALAFFARYGEEISSWPKEISKKLRLEEGLHFK